MSKAKDQENYVDLFSSKIADKIKTEPEIEQPKVKKVKVEAKAEPKIDIFEAKVLSSHSDNSTIRADNFVHKLFINNIQLL